MQDKVREIKQSFRTMMNGIVSHSMREKGAGYKVNFGVELPRIQAFAEEVNASLSDDERYKLALDLRTDVVRECRLLATMLMPPDKVDEAMADLWVEECRESEERQVLVMQLLQYLPLAADMAFRYIGQDAVALRSTGWMLFSRLFMRGMQPSQRDADEILDQVAADLAPSVSMSLRLDAHKALMKFAELGNVEAVRAEEVMNSIVMTV